MEDTNTRPDPDFINYLLDPKQQYECYFVFENPKLTTPPEKIGVVKKMLMAHSVVLRAELKESRLAEKEIVKIKDLFPETVKLMLRYVYGYDTTQTLCFDDADNLLYAAEKYLITSLRDKLLVRLKDLLTYDNICGLMNNPVCKQILEVNGAMNKQMLEMNSAMNKILQNETDKVLASQQFLSLSPDAFLSILQREMVNVPELELWRSAVRWAKNRAGSEDGKSLREELSQHVQHLRVCTLPIEEFCREIVPEGVLSYEEVKLVGLYHRTGEKQVDLTTICNNTEKRVSPKSDPITASLSSTGYNISNTTSVSLVTKGQPLELTSLVLSSYCSQSHNCQVTVDISGSDNTSHSLQVSGHAVSTADFTVSLDDKGKPVELRPNTTYTVTTTFSDHNYHYSYYSSTRQSTHQFDHFTCNMSAFGGHYQTHIRKLIYKTICSM